jgi:hypothetical protein
MSDPITDQLNSVAGLHVTSKHPAKGGGVAYSAAFEGELHPLELADQINGGGDFCVANFKVDSASRVAMLLIVPASACRRFRNVGFGIAAVLVASALLYAASLYVSRPEDVAMSFGWNPPRVASAAVWAVAFLVLTFTIYQLPRCAIRMCGWDKPVRARAKAD